MCYLQLVVDSILINLFYLLLLTRLYVSFIYIMKNCENIQLFLFVFNSYSSHYLPLLTWEVYWHHEQHSQFILLVVLPLLFRQSTNISSKSISQTSEETSPTISVPRKSMYSSSNQLRQKGEGEKNRITNRWADESINAYTHQLYEDRIKN